MKIAHYCTNSGVKELEFVVDVGEAAPPAPDAKAPRRDQPGFDSSASERALTTANIAAMAAVIASS
jgi:hypothetical protein